MFAVRGWSVSADKLKAETVAGAAPVDKTAKPEDKAASNKRKRPQAEVTSSNVADLWDQVIGGKPVGGNKKKAKTQRAGGSVTVAQSQTSQPASTKAEDSEGKGSKPAVVTEVSSPQADRSVDAAVEGKKAKKRKSKNQVRDSEAGDSAPKEEQQTHQNGGGSHDAPTDKTGKNAKKSKKAGKDHEQSLESQQQPESKDTARKTQDGGDSLTKTIAAPPPAAPKLTPLQAAMREKLISARFRHLNEMLYTRPSAEAFQLLDDTPEMFTEYHEGFRRQVDVWPENPVDGYLEDIKQRGQVKAPPKGKFSGGRGNSTSTSNNDNSSSTTPGGPEPLPRTSGTCTIADLGCGDAKLAAELQSKKKALRLNILSYDLQSPSPHVTRADIANLPLADGSVSVAIFCLALMGTNWLDFVEEAYRVLHWKGELWVAEIKSRLGHVGAPGGKKAPGNVVTHSVGNRKKAAAAGKKTGADNDDKARNAALAIEVDGAEDRRQETDVKAFVEALRKRGFVLQGEADLRNKMFVKMRFLKAAPATVGKNAFPTAADSGGGGRGGRGGAGDRGGRGGRDSRMGRVSSKFVDAEDESNKVDEGGILKPCVYKIR
ncbi:ribosomal RNA-processing protein 8 [Microdochium nivale]|nr:ribosomal RNA-processing protein 8 [Microdochium nivale]